ncbi:unnamed protein product [Durusdinium trenchii]|uniref:Uncharacterized protein n=1 Tax=Durusdinium trenchii TaxID=1381693 RepID=A0ABP0KAX0_9DINO
MTCAICTLCVSWYAYTSWSSGFISGLADIAKEHSKSWSCQSCSIELSEAIDVVAQVPDQMAYDQYGQALVQATRDSSRGIWPKAGVNLILVLNVKAEEFAPHWIPATMAPTQFGMPGAGMALPGMVQPVAQAQVHAGDPQ